jgi:hypothetical protein
MRHNIVTAQTSAGRAVAMLVERVPGRLLEDAHAAQELSGSLASAIADALSREAQDQGPAGGGRGRCSRRAEADPRGDLHA